MKTDQERIDYLANRVREFNIQVSGGGLIDGGFGKLPPIGQGDITVEDLEQAFSEFRLTGNNGIQAHGSLQNGYLLFGNPPAGDEGPGFAPIIPGGGGGPPTNTGACCMGVDCSITTEADCEGVYKGDNTNCDPNPCITECMLPATATFSGISTFCTCVNFFGTRYEILSSNFHSNATFSPFTDYGGGFYQLTTVDLVHTYDRNSWFTSGCTGDPTTEGNVSVLVTVICNSTTHLWTIAMHGGGLLLFYADSIPDPTIPTANQAICGHNYVAIVGEDALGAATDGTGVLTF